MNPGFIRYAVLVAALALAGPARGQDPGSVPAPEPKPYEQVVKLWKAQLSEEFLLRKIEREQVAYRLSTDDIIACKVAGVPESIIEAMMKTGGRPTPAAKPVVPPVVQIPQATPAPTVPPAPTAPPVPPAPPAVPAVAIPPAAPAASAPGPTPPADHSWDGLVRRSPGVVLFRPRWEPGKLSFLEGEIRWLDAADAARNVVLSLAMIQEQFLVCPNDASSDSSCFEWGVKTADSEFRFRDAGGRRVMSSKPLDLFNALKAIAPNLAARKYSAKKD